jgi:hypothetical protein
MNHAVGFKFQFLLFYLFQVVLPDTEFIINLGDWPLVLKTKNPEEQVKYFFLKFIFSPNYVLPMSWTACLFALKYVVPFKNAFLVFELSVELVLFS